MKICYNLVNNKGRKSDNMKPNVSIFHLNEDTFIEGYYIWDYLFLWAKTFFRFNF